MIHKYIQSHDPFRMTIWDPDFKDFDVNYLSNLVIDQIICDSQIDNAQYLTIAPGTTIGIMEKEDGHFVVKFVKFEGCIKDQGNNHRIRISYGDGRKRFSKKTNTKREIPYTHLADHIVTSRRLDIDRLSTMEGVYDQMLASTDSPLEFMLDQARLDRSRLTRLHHCPDGKIHLQLLQRTQTIVVLNKNIEQIENMLLSQIREGIYFADVFSTIFMRSIDDGAEYGLSTLPYQHCGREADILVFSRIGKAIEYIENHRDRHFLLITDCFAQVYSPTSWQQIAANDNYRLIHLAQWSDFKYLYNDSLVNDDIQTIKRIVINGKLPNRRAIKNAVFEVKNDDVESIVTKLAEQRNLLKNTNRNLASLCSKYISLICRSLAIDNPDAEIHRLDNMIGLSLEKNIYSSLDGNNPKRNKLVELAEEFKLILITGQVDFVNKLNLHNIGAKYLAECDHSILDECFLVIYYIDKWFLMNILFPQIMLGKINLSDIMFVLYPSEVKALYGIYQQYYRSVKPFINDDEIASGNDALEGEYGDYVDFHEITYDFELLTKGYYTTHTRENDDSIVKVKTLGLSGEGQDYYAFFTGAYKPYIIEDDNLIRANLESLSIGDAVVVFEGAGERGILEAYKDIFFVGDLKHIDNIKKWKKYLAEYLQFDGKSYNRPKLNNLLKELTNQGLNRSKIDILRWLDSESIGTAAPRYDFRIISNAIGNSLFNAEYMSLAESCVYLQTKCKAIGRILKKLALKDYAGAGMEIDSKYNVPNIDEKIAQIMQKIKCLRVKYIDHSERYVSRFHSNVLIEATNGQINPALF
jgi:hypothetical protein